MNHFDQITKRVFLIQTESLVGKVGQMKALLSSYDLKFTHPNLLDSPGFHPFMELPPKAFVSRYCHLLESFLSLSRIALDIIE